MIEWFVCLLKPLKTKTDGKETERLDVKLPFFVRARQTLKEKLDGQTFRDVDNQLASLKDKDERQSLSPSFDNDVYGKSVL
ncbi:hypothetical protein [Candidatus Williamhamiltonella defendens]|uniref:hypothetical protein n=1 Tax=Candidatus Williamhamiltonella defendens TaxID=138072 RepID=UPI001C9DA53D|nr:hypothetical protein [Candidatus Hamiltonella defensa]